MFANRLIVLGVVLLTASVFAQAPGPDMRGGAGNGVSNQQDANQPPMVDGKPALGPMDPGPWPLMPGYFTKKAIRLNYERTPFFNGRGGCGVSGYGVGQDYFPGVYPYYDAQYHYQWYMAYARERQLLKHAEQTRGTGIELFRAGDYEQAAVKFLGAAELDQGDAAARIHAAHSLFALGQYADAFAVLKRALELQPRLAYGGYDPRADYGRREEFESQLRTLRNHVDEHPADWKAQTMLGYMIFLTDGSTRAKPMLVKAHELASDDALVTRLWSVVTRTSLNEDVARTTRRDERTYDQMGVKPQKPTSYDEAKKTKRTPPNDQAKKKRDLKPA